MVILAFLLFIVGIIGAFVPVVPGPPLSYIGLLIFQRSGYGEFSPAFLWIFLAITLMVMAMDFFLPSLLAKKFGGSRAASRGSFLGLIAGMFFFPPLGLILGSFLGALIGELIHNRNSGLKALKVASSALLAFIAGSGAKLILSAVILSYAIRAFF